MRTKPYKSTARIEKTEAPVYEPIPSVTPELNVLIGFFVAISAASGATDADLPVIA
jgi:hypothetical protein